MLPHATKCIVSRCNNITFPRGGSVDIVVGHLFTRNPFPQTKKKIQHMNEVKLTKCCRVEGGTCLTIRYNNPCVKDRHCPRRQCLRQSGLCVAYHPVSIPNDHFLFPVSGVGMESVFLLSVLIREPQRPASITSSQRYGLAETTGLQADSPSMLHTVVARPPSSSTHLCPYDPSTVVSLLFNLQLN